ncbi:MAG TPA: Ig-like domain-containing protein [Syntrophales bacterium]|nr:Ig-like domain-containing protein [Syntrophales bacterium]HOU77236.1 Ig-like domain-containing protein [Syntrophales bacterium]HPC32879.1 Ig-like domain-containing protein [Syntrophales bacterium]
MTRGTQREGKMRAHRRQRGWRAFPVLLAGCLALLCLLPLPAAAVGVAAHFAPPALTPLWADYLGLLRIDGVDARPGDEIAFFDPQGVLCGSYTVDQTGLFGIVRVYGDDPATPDVDEGAVAGDVLTVKIWDSRRQVELTGPDLVLRPGTPPGGSSFLAATVPPVWQDRQGYVLDIDTAGHYASPAVTPYIGNYLGALTIEGVPADIGDEVAVFDSDGILCGHTRITTPGQYGIMEIYGDDPATGAVDEGATEDGTLTFKVWSKKTGKEYAGEKLRLVPGTAAGSFLPSLAPPVWRVDTGYVLNIEALEEIVPPPVATVAGVPSSPTGQTGATLTVGGAGVVVYKYKLDSGVYSGEVSVAEPIVLSGLTAGEHTLYVLGKNTYGNWQAETGPTAVVWTVDLTAPVTTLISGPAEITNSYEAVFVFSANEPATFLCLLDDGEFTSCTSPLTITGLTEGNHHFTVKATDGAGNVETAPPGHSWLVDLTPPVATVAGVPSSPTGQTGATLTMGGAGVTAYRYRLDGGVYSGETPVTTPIVLSGLTEGRHTVSVIGRDAAGNWQAEGAATEVSWLVDTQAPQLTVTEPPEGYKTHLLALTLRGQVQDITAVTVAVTLEGEVYHPAVTGGAFSQPLSFPARNRDYVIEVRAVDELGRQTGLQRTVTVINTPPVLKHTTVGTQAGKSVEGTLTATDADADLLTIREGPPLWYFYICSTMYPWSTYGYLPLSAEEMLAVITGGHKGMLVLDQETGRYLYTPRPGATGEDIFVFRANDGEEDSGFAYLKIVIGAMAGDGQGEEPTATPLAVLPGDINGDNKVDLADAILSLQTAAGRQTTVNIAGDVNGDHRIGLAETLYALQYISGLRGSGAAAYAVADYFPVQVGDWRDFRDEGTGTVYRTVVSGTKPIGGMSAFVFSYASGYREYYTTDAAGLMLHGVYEPAGSLPGEYLFDAPLLLMTANARIGDRQVSSAHYSFSLYGVTYQVLITTATTLVGLQDVTTQNGVVKDCLLVSLERTETMAGQTQPFVSTTILYWFAKDIGCVRQVDQTQSVTISAASVKGNYRSF